jgi:hypothetical protein
MDIKTLSEEWIKAEEQDDSSEQNHWSIDYVIELPLDGKFEELWSFVQYTYKKDISKFVIENLAAGPLEDLLTYAGESYIEEIEQLASNDPKFRSVLGGVWKNNMTDQVWERVQDSWDRTGWDN